jgi:hypothetical protein
VRLSLKALESDGVQSEIVPPVSVEELWFANRMMAAVCSGQMPTRAFHDSERSGFALGNTPANHAAIAVLEVFRGEPGKGHALLARCVTLAAHWRKPQAARWMRQDEAGGLDVDACLMEATAQLPFHFMEDDIMLGERLFELAAKIEKQGLL